MLHGMADGTYTITNWPVFCAGTHKESAEYFSPRDIQQIASNFRRLSHLPVVGKLGHDRQQRYRDSLGLPSALGRVVSLHAEPDGTLVLDKVTGIPRVIASAIRSGFLPGVSIELAPRGEPGRRIIRDPNDPSAPIDGDILTGIAFLGEELPAVPGFETPIPRDESGQPAPPLSDDDVRWWLEKQAPFLTGAGSEPGKDGDRDAEASFSIAFSAFTFTPGARPPLDLQAVIAALQALPPDQQQQAIAAVAAPPAGQDPNNMSGSDGLRGANQEGQLRAINAKEPENPTHDTYAAMGGDKDDPLGKSPTFKAFMASCEKRFGALEEKATADQKDKDASEMSAHRSRVDAALREKDIAKKVAPVALPAVKDQLLGILASKTFAATADRDAAFASALDIYAALPVNPMLRDAAVDARPAGKPGELTPLQQIMLNSEPMRRIAPGVRTLFQPA